MGRREQRAELEATWVVYEPLTPGRPITRADRDASLSPDEAANRHATSLASGSRLLRGLARRRREAAS